MHERHSNYDLLRIVSTIAVIIIHVSGKFFAAINDGNVLGRVYDENVAITLVYYGASRFAVPCFVMLSGALILSDDRNKNIKYFYKKAIRNLGGALIIFNAVYFFYSFSQNLFGVIFRRYSVGELLDPVYDFFIGSTYYHMWYLSMLIGLYLLVPFIIRFKTDVGESVFVKVAFAFILFACLSKWTSIYKMRWDIGCTFCYCGYFMCGYAICIKSKKKNNSLGLLEIVGGCILAIGAGFIEYWNKVSNTNLNIKALSFIEPYCPIIVVASILIFSGFSMLMFDFDLKKLSKMTFYIYLFHAGIWDIGIFLVKRFCKANGNNIVLIPLSVIFVLIGSIFCSQIYIKYFQKVEDNIADKICKMLRL